MLIRADSSFLLVVDLQQRLAPAIHEMGQVLGHNLWLMDVASELEVPVVVTEQYPSGLGASVPEVAERVLPAQVVEKIHFSAVADGCLKDLPEMARPQVVVTGTEAHVCVLQTALDLRLMGKEVFIVAEAVGSRQPHDKALALERLRQAGCEIVSREMVAFEWLHRAGTECFRKVCRSYLR